MKKCFFVTVSILLLASTCYAADQAPAPQEPDEIEIHKAAIEKSIPCYTANLKDLVTKAECRIKKIEARLGPEELAKAAEAEHAKEISRTQPAETAAAAPKAPEPPVTPAALAAPAEPAPQKPPAAALHDSWYTEEKQEKTPEPEQPGIGAIIEKR